MIVAPDKVYHCIRALGLRGDEYKEAQDRLMLKYYAKIWRRRYEGMLLTLVSANLSTEKTGNGHKTCMLEM